jgi:hypothetical protein
MRHVGPFETHIREALELNRHRAAYYASLTSGASNAVFRRYMLAERTVLPAAMWFDWRARPYHSAGVPLLSSVFVSMSAVPQLSRPVERRSDDGWSPDVTHMVSTLRSSSQSAGFEGLARAADVCLQVLADRPWRDCMLRHQIESLRRAANVSPINIDNAIGKGLRSPEPLLRQFMRFHLHGVRLAPWLDNRALGLQVRGITILANDLPHVPPWPDDWRSHEASR